MSLVGDDEEPGIGQMTQEEVAVGRGTAPVLGALPDVHRRRDVAEIEAPGIPEDPVVLQAPVGALSHRLLDEGHRLGRRPHGLDHRPVDPGDAPEHFPVQASLGGVGDHDAHEGGGQAGRPVHQEEQDPIVEGEAPGRAEEVEGDGTREQGHPGHPITQARPAHGRIGTTSGPAHDGEPVDVERPGQRHHVGGPIEQAAVGLIGRLPHAGPIGGDQANAELRGRGVGRCGIEPGAQAAVEAQDGPAAGIAVLLEGQHPPIGHGDEAGHGGGTCGTCQVVRSVLRASPMRAWPHPPNRVNSVLAA